MSILHWLCIKFGFWLFEMVFFKSFVDMGRDNQPHIFEVTVMNHISTRYPFGRIKHQHQSHQIHKTLTPRFQYTL